MNTRPVRRQDDFISLQAENERLKEKIKELEVIAFTDHLTGLHNRLSFGEKVKKLKGVTSLAFIDLDHFKVVNDTHTHRAGDEVLKAVAELLVDGVRKNDFVARFGGEEIVVLMPNTNLPLASVLGERIRSSIESRFREPIESLGKTIRITASVGIASMGEGGDITTLLTTADAALYLAKDGGRNRVICQEKIVAGNKKKATPPKTRKRK